MMTMFPSGTLNGDRMVIAHSPSFSNWGLQYLDSSDKFHFLSNGTSVMTVDLGNQKVGIGTKTPTSALEVGGQVTITGGAPGLGKVLTSDANGLASWTTPGATPWSVSGNNIFNTNTANVGIGTTTPSVKLDVKSASSFTAKFNGGSNMYMGIFENDLYRGYIGSFAGNAADVDFGTTNLDPAAAEARALVELKAVGYTDPFALARMWARVGDRDRTMRWLLAADRDESGSMRLDVQDEFDFMRGYPPFDSLSKRVAPR